MKICIAIEKFDPAVGGAERYCWDLAHYLVDKGHSVAVICMQASVARHPSITVRRLRPLKFPQGLRHLSFALMHRRVARGMTIVVAALVAAVVATAAMVVVRHDRRSSQRPESEKRCQREHVLRGPLLCSRSTALH